MAEPDPFLLPSHLTSADPLHDTRAAKDFDIGSLIYQDAAEEALSPIQKLYFTSGMLEKYEPLYEMVVAEGDKDEDAWNEFEEHFDKFVDVSFFSSWDGTKYDMIFYGVSGYTGYLMMEYLKRVSLKTNPEPFTFAFAGRNVAKVAEMRDREFIGTAWEDTPILQASYDDIVSVVDLARSARLIVNVAGPYMLAQGEILIDACCFCGTDYVDVAGEIPWTIRTLDLHAHAVEGNACIVPSAAVAGGNPDLLTFLCAKKLREETGEELRRAICYCRGGGISAGTSGGTLATRAAMGVASDDIRKKMADPYTLGGFIPDIDRWGKKECTVQQGTGNVSLLLRREDTDAVLSKVSQCPYTGVWRAPWIYSYFDTRIVRRSNMMLATLANQPYGVNFCFQEFMMLPPDALLQAAAVKEEGSAMNQGPVKSTVDKEKEALQKAGKYYKQGEGPTLEEVSEAWLAFFVWAQTTGGHETRCSFVGGDGYFETARSAIELAMTLLFDKAELPFKGGVLNAAVCGQSWYAQRMIQSGIKFKMGEWHTEKQLTPPLGNK